MPEDERQRQRGAVLGALAAELSARSLHDDAAVAHLAAGDLPAALEAYRSGGSFQMALALAGALIPLHVSKVRTCLQGAPDSHKPSQFP